MKMTIASKAKVTVLGINGHIGHHAAAAFVAAGWDVVGMGRSDKLPIIVRAVDFFAPGNHGDWFDQGILAQKGKVSAPSELAIGHSWAYLPDLGRAFEKLAWHRNELAAFENFHFAGHFVTSGEL